MQGILKCISIKAGKGLLNNPIAIAELEAELGPAEANGLNCLVGKPFQIESAETIADAD